MFVNEVMHPQAEELTKAMFKFGAPTEDRIYAVVEEIKGVSNVAKADLYALLVESDLDKLNTMDAGTEVSRCLHINQQRYPRGW